MTSFPLPKMSDVIGPICSGYVPFRTVELIATAFSEIEVAWMIDMSVFGSFRQTFVRDNLKFLASEKINPRRVSNHGPLGRRILRSERSSTVLAGPGRVVEYMTVTSVR